MNHRRNHGLRSRSLGRLGALAIALASLGMSLRETRAQGTRDLETWKADLARLVANQKRGDPRPKFDEVDLPVLERAKSKPDLLWSFLTNPETPHLELWAAVRRTRELPLSLLQRLLETQDALQLEERHHGWMMRRHPMSAYSGFPSTAQNPAGGRSRTVLGHRWEVPAERSGFPFSWDEEAKAPWPWRIQKALDGLFANTLPRHCDDYAQAWLAKSLELPIDSDEAATRFVRATSLVRPCSNLYVRVLARWRKIALDPKRPGASCCVGQSLSDLHAGWRSPRGRRLCRIVAEDILAKSPTARARQNVAYNLRHMKLAKHPKRARAPDLLPLLPTGAILRASKLALDSKAGSHWTRLYAYAFSVCEVLDEPPFKPDRWLDPKSPRVKELLEEFAEWFESQRESLERADDARGKVDRELREKLTRLSR